MGQQTDGCLKSLFFYERRHEKTCFCICENKGADQLCGKCIQSLYFPNLQFQVSNHLLLLYSPVDVGPGRKSPKQVLS